MGFASSGIIKDFTARGRYNVLGGDSHRYTGASRYIPVPTQIDARYGAQTWADYAVIWPIKWCSLTDYVKVTTFRLSPELI